ncbi:DUF3641 domain-containing protein [Oceanimonas sp. NS1]|nr:DUF3641 domain-containing protein [Oceanimonas sp. NS1]
MCTASVAAGPHRTEMMDADTLALIPRVLQARGIGTLDLTGGAPKCTTAFATWCGCARARGQGHRPLQSHHIAGTGVRGSGGVPGGNRVEIVASLPCYAMENVDRQRGKGSFDKSIIALQRLNALGYGKPGSGLVLNHGIQPARAQPASPQDELEAAYRTELHRHFGIEFNHLFALANMPIKRFGDYLISKRQFQ